MAWSVNQGSRCSVGQDSKTSGTGHWCETARRDIPYAWMYSRCRRGRLPAILIENELTSTCTNYGLTFRNLSLQLAQRLLAITRSLRRSHLSHPFYQGSQGSSGVEASFDLSSTPLFARLSGLRKKHGSSLLVSSGDCCDLVDLSTDAKKDEGRKRRGNIASGYTGVEHAV